MNHLKDFLEKQECICVVGLGYVGLPLAVLFNSKYNVIGFDINTKRIEELKNGSDRTGEISKKELSSCSIQFTDNSEIISKAKVIIVTVPTPIDKYNQTIPLRLGGHVNGSLAGHFRRRTGWQCVEVHYGCSTTGLCSSLFL